MRRLQHAGFSGRFRCIYFDPPFNSGRRFTEYRDAESPETWLNLMRERIAAAHELLATDGALFVEIDDTELGPLHVAMDHIFGREQRISTITVVRSAATGHKAVNRGPINVTDFLLVYAKNRRNWRCNALVQGAGPLRRRLLDVARESERSAGNVALRDADCERAANTRPRTQDARKWKPMPSSMPTMSYALLSRDTTQ